MACNLTEGRTIQNLDTKWDNKAFRPFTGVVSIPPNILLDHPTSSNPELRWSACGIAPSQSQHHMQSGSLESMQLA